MTNEFWSKLKKHFRIELFGYDFVFSLASYFSVRNFQFPYFPLNGVERVGICSHFSEANVLSLLRYVYSQDVCLFYYVDDDLEEFVLQFIDHLSPILLDAMRRGVVVALKKYIQDVSDFIYQHEDSFNRGELRTLWIVYKDKFDMEFLDQYIQHPLFFSWYFKNKEQDYENDKLKNEQDIYVQNPTLYSALKKRGQVGNLTANERKDMMTEIRQSAEAHRKLLEGNRNKNE